MDREAQRAIVHGLSESDMTELLSLSRARTHTHTHTHTHTFLQLPGSSDCCTLSIVRTCCSGFPGSSVGEESACSAGSPSLIPWLGRSPGGGHGSPLQHPCLNPQGQRSRAGCSPWGRREPDKTEHSTVIAVCLLSSPFLTNGFTADSLSPLHHYAGETEGAL